MFAIPAIAQHETALTGTIVDSDSQAWANGTWRADIVVPAGGVAKYFDGTSVPVAYQGKLDGLGVMNVGAAVGNTAVIYPAGTGWRFTFCSNTSASCSVTPLTYPNGAALDLSSYARTNITAPRIGATNLVYAYRAGEVINPIQGSGYINTSTSTCYTWVGTGSFGSWQPNCGSGGVSITGNPNYYVTIGPDGKSIQQSPDTFYVDNGWTMIHSGRFFSQFNSAYWMASQVGGFSKAVQTYGSNADVMVEPGSSVNDNAFSAGDAYFAGVPAADQSAHVDLRYGSEQWNHINPSRNPSNVGSGVTGHNCAFMSPDTLSAYDCLGDGIFYDRSGYNNGTDNLPDQGAQVTNGRTDLFYDNGAGIKVGWTKFFRAMGVGDEVIDQILAYVKPGATGGSDEGTDVTRQHVVEAPLWTGLLNYGNPTSPYSSGETYLHLDNNSHNSGEFLGVGHPMLDITSDVQTGTATVVSQPGNTYGVALIQVPFTVPVSISGTLVNLVDPTADNAGQPLTFAETIPETVTLTLASDAGSVAGQTMSFIDGAAETNAAILSVGAYAGGQQSFTVAVQRSHGAGTQVRIGGASGRYLEQTTDTTNGHIYPADVFGSPSANTLEVGFQQGGSIVATQTYIRPGLVKLYHGAKVAYLPPVGRYMNDGSVIVVTGELSGLSWKENDTIFAADTASQGWGHNLEMESNDPYAAMNGFKVTMVGNANKYQNSATYGFSVGNQTPNRLTAGLLMAGLAPVQVTLSGTPQNAINTINETGPASYCTNNINGPNYSLCTEKLATINGKRYVTHPDFQDNFHFAPVIQQGITTGDASPNDLAGVITLNAGQTTSQPYAFGNFTPSVTAIPSCNVQPFNVPPALAATIGVYVPEITTGGVLTVQVQTAPASPVSFAYTCTRHD